jgi:shikimate dehydrogenase
MAGGPGAGDIPVPVEMLHEGHVVADLVYHPLDTPLLRGARERGAAVVDGLGMLVHQAGLQIEQWTAKTAPIPAMRAAVERELRSDPST